MLRNQRFLKLSSFFSIPFPFCYFFCFLFIPCLPNCWFSPLVIYPTIYSFQCVIYFIYCLIFEWSFFTVSMSLFMLLSILITITLNCISDKWFASIYLVIHLEDSLVLSSRVCFFVVPFWLPLFVCFYMFGRSAKMLVPASIRHYLWLALGNLFGAISYPQLLSPSSRSGGMQRE